MSNDFTVLLILLVVTFYWSDSHSHVVIYINTSGSPKRLEKVTHPFVSHWKEGSERKGWIIFPRSQPACLNSCWRVLASRRPNCWRYVFYGLFLWRLLNVNVISWNFVYRLLRPHFLCWPVAAHCWTLPPFSWCSRLSCLYCPVHVPVLSEITVSSSFTTRLKQKSLVMSCAIGKFLCNVIKAILYLFI